MGCRALLSLIVTLLSCGSVLADGSIHPELETAVTWDYGMDGRDPNSSLITLVSRSIAEVLKVFFSGFLPDPTGNDHPNPDENAVDQILKRIGDSRFQLLLQGGGNLKVLGGPFLYSELQGGVGVEYDFFRNDELGKETPDGATVVAIRVSPAFGEIAFIRLASGAGAMSGLPYRVFVGPNFGLEASRRWGRLEPGIRAYVHPEWDAGGDHDFGTVLYGAAYCRFRIADLKTALLGGHGLYLRPMVEVFDRGMAKQALYAWNTDRNMPLDRNAADLRVVKQLVLHLEVKF